MGKIINIYMTVSTILYELLNDKLILSEAFHSGHKIHYGNQSTYVEVYKNPDLSEVNNVIRAATYDGAKIGIDSNNDVYIWVDDILHSVMERALEKEFILRFDYTHGNKILFMAQGMTEAIFKKHKSDILLTRLKQIFPAITTIEMVSRPFTTVYKYED